MSRWGALALILFVLAGTSALGGWLYSRQALFRVKSVDVRVDDETLKKSLEESLLAYSGRSMLTLKLGELEGLLLRRSEIRSARIRRVWPNTLILEAELKKPVALEFQGEALWVVDEKGEGVSPLRRASALPLLWGFDKHAHLKAEFLKWYHEELLREAQGDGMLERLDEVLQDEGIVLGFRSLGLRVQLGQRDWSKRWQSAKAAFVAMQKRGRLALVLDASLDGRVFVYESVELHNSQSGLNLKELVRRTRDAKAEVR